MFSNDKITLGANVKLITQNETCAVYQLEESSGDGMMTCYRIFPGVFLMFNDFHMEHCTSELMSHGDMFCVDYCREGRIEWEIAGNSYVYVESGDMQINDRDRHAGDFSFPLSHYHGVTVGFMLDDAKEPLSDILEGWTFDIPAMKQKFCSTERPFIVRANMNVEHIFSELFALPDPIRVPYLRIKVLELLLFLSMLEKPESGWERPYFYKTQVAKIKTIRRFLTENYERYYTLEELSKRFDFPLTAMKLCFKGVYGTSMYAYMKAYRMDVAALMLRQSNDKVADIAGRVGYDNASKFATAFKSLKGMTPAEYRKSAVRTEP